MRCIYHTRWGAQSPDPSISRSLIWSYNADEASALLKALAMQLNKTGWDECALHSCMSILVLLDSSTGWQWQNFTHRALLMATDYVTIPKNADALGRIWSSVFYLTMNCFLCWDTLHLFDSVK